MDSQGARDRAGTMLAAWNRRDYGEVAKQVTSDVVLVDHTRGRTSIGSDRFVDRFRRVLDAFPDMQGETVSVLVEGNLVVQETIWQGRHTAPLLVHGYEDLPPTNELKTMHLVTYVEFDDEGQAKALRIYGDPGEVPLSANPAGVG
jgi:hypothetical protein